MLKGAFYETFYSSVGSQNPITTRCPLTGREGIETTFICKHMMFHYHVVFLRIVPIRSLFGKYDNNQFPKLSLSYNTSVEGDRLLLRYGEGCLCVDWLLERWGVACAEVFQQNQNATRRKFHSVLTRQITDSDRLIYCQSL